MANELAETESKQITSKLIDSIIVSLQDGSKSGKVASQWWSDNKVTLIGLAVAEVITILQNAATKKDLMKQYDALVASMAWQERVEFLKSGIEELRESNSKKIRTATIIVALLELAPKVLPLILAAV